MLLSILSLVLSASCATASPTTDSTWKRADLKVDTASLPSPWTYSGCFLDSATNRTLNFDSYSDNALTGAKCINFCSTRGYSFAGTQFSKQCFCGYDANPSKSAPAAECNMPCSGAANEPCGGRSRLTVYTNGEKPPAENPGPVGWSSLGCYSDSVQSRTLSLFIPSRGNPVTVATCTTECERRGFSYAGLEFARQCFCGNAIQGAGAPAFSGCDTPCTGNRTELCGGRSSLNLYRRQGVASTTTAITTATSTTATSTVTTTVTTTTSSSTTITTTTTAPGASGSLTVLDSVVVSTPGPGYRAPGLIYARSVQLPDGSFLATSENHAQEPPAAYLPIFKSTDYGKTWSQISRVVDTQRGYGARQQPFLYVLPTNIGDYPAGTVLASANFIPSDYSSTNIDIYASRDGGLTWEYVSNVASGGPTRSGAIWQPFLIVHDNALAVYYGDQRDSRYAQRIVHQVSSDLKTWGAFITDVSSTNPAYIFGIPTVARLASGEWILVYEFLGAPEGGAPAHYKIASDPSQFGATVGSSITAPGNVRPAASPFVVVTNTGRILVTGGEFSEIFINDANGSRSAWRAFTPKQERAYARGLTLVKQNGSDKQFLLITGAGWFNGQATNQLKIGIIDQSAIPGVCAAPGRKH